MTTPWLESARAKIGKLHDGSDVVMLARENAQREPENAEYWGQAKPDTPWCGVLAAHELILAGVHVGGPRSDGIGPMYVDWWKDYGTEVPVDQKQDGDLALWFGNPHHISIVAGSKYIGGNQSDGVTEASFRTPDMIRRPPSPQSAPVAPPVTSALFERVHPIIAKWEGGYSNDPCDSGGPTNFGITQARLAEARGHSVTAADVKALTYAEALTIFKRYYWTPLLCDQLPPALALMTYNTGVNSGPSRGARFLQQSLNKQGAGLAEDGEIGSLTIAAARGCRDITQAVKDYSATYEAFYRSLSNFNLFGRGWLNRLSDVTATALQWAKETPMADETAVPNPPAPSSAVTIYPPQPDPLKSLADAVFKSLIADIQAHPEKLAALLGGITGKAAPTSPAPATPSPATPATPAPAAPTTGLAGVLSALGGGSNVTFWTGVATLVANVALNAMGVVGSPAGAGATVIGQILPAVASSGILGGLFGKLGSIFNALKPKQ